MTYKEKLSNELRKKLRDIRAVVKEFFEKDDGRYANEEDEWSYIDSIIDKIKEIIESS